MSSGAVLLDEDGRLLILKPTYKKGWTIPGGIVEKNGESPWDACRREVSEETGLTVTRGRLVCVDTRPTRDGTQIGLRYLFHCGVLTAAQLRSIKLQDDEVSEYCLADEKEALKRLRPPVARRVREGLRAQQCVYLENGRRIAEVT